MIKYFALLIPFLMACSSQGTPARSVHEAALGLPAPSNPTDTETPYVSKMVARGTDGINEWYCTDTDANKSLVWVECRFRNTWTPNVAGNSTDNSCIRVRFYETETMKKVVESRQICSGSLKAKQEVTRYVAFESTKKKHDRKLFDFCGNDFKKCVMLTVRVNE